LSNFNKIKNRILSLFEAIKLIFSRRHLKGLHGKFNNNKSKKYDVVVVGGGISGLSAAISSSRNGMSTLLIEKQGELGGLVTSGWVTPFSMQMVLPDGKLIMKGLISELFDRLAEKDGTVRDWKDWKIPKLPVDKEIFKLVIHEMVEEANVEVLLNTSVLSIEYNNNLINQIKIFNKSGYQDISGKVFIDATGEADIARLSKVPMTLNNDVDPNATTVISDLLKNNGWVKRTEKNSSLQFSITNVDFNKTFEFILNNKDMYASTTRGDLVEDVELFKYLWIEKGFFYLPHTISFESIIENAVKKDKIRSEIGRYQFLLHGVGIGIDALKSNNTAIINANRVSMNPFNENDITYCLLKGQEVCFEIWRFLKTSIPGFSKSVVSSVAPYLGVRRAAQIIGNHIYTAEERMSFLKYDDVIGLASRKTARAYEIPFSLMVPKKIDNLLVASGKTVSCDDFLPYRTKPICMALGQAAGVASALFILKNNKSFNMISINDLQKKLLDNNVYLGDHNRLKELDLIL
tara:strand:- start:1398 stop:2954 length:1557 start_codon:yes stop_codon:yes gene_type:complete